MEIAIVPRFLIKKMTAEYYRQNDFNILISNIIIVLVFVVFGSSLISILSYIPHFCLIDRVTEIECPVCGITRAFCELSSGNIIDAYFYNKMSILVALFFIFQIPLRLISILKIVRTTKINFISKKFGRLILTLILINWIINLFTNH